MYKGLLTIKVTDEITNFPIEGVSINICAMPKEGSTKSKYIYRNLITNSSGIVKKVSLDAPNFIYSQVPNSPRAYSTYILTISKDGYQSVIIQGVQILPLVEAIQNISLSKTSALTKTGPQVYKIGDNVLYGNYQPKILEDDLKPVPYVLSNVVVPEYIIVHDGMPSDKNAPNYWIPFRDYIKNVASSEIYATWPTETIYANVVAIVSFTLNRVYTEWYRNMGYNFTITSTTAYDHKFIYNRNIFDTISVVVDNIFNVYIQRPKGNPQPLLAQYCDGIQTKCPGKMTQWGSKYLGDQGYKFDEILRYYYGQNIGLQGTDMIKGVPSSFPGYTLTLWSTGESVKTIQNQLNAISKAYPALPKVDVDGIYGPKTQESVRKFQEIFRMTQTGNVDFATWYAISKIYVAVTKIAEFEI
ncbi:peptidoglycan-binding protein [Paraclostridium bifermentans]|uniref:peptidoglycan-binding protein n=1 Tax=Paraclostridium bifermentans TaxID=1490 RepID=UPI001C7F853F|nr:peptidoglycan-binding domain-containing protein [Paraclostridium bifermentans]GIM33560.1 peptidoglycan-binding protein [Paraclostridium bifermentans subsp. muricolitidis]